jgi:hypothetical protein
VITISLWNSLPEAQAAESRTVAIRRELHGGHHASRERRPSRVTFRHQKWFPDYTRAADLARVGAAWTARMAAVGLVSGSGFEGPVAILRPVRAGRLVLMSGVVRVRHS